MKRSKRTATPEEVKKYISERIKIYTDLLRLYNDGTIHAYWDSKGYITFSGRGRNNLV